MGLWATKRERAELYQIINEKMSAHSGGVITTAGVNADAKIAAQHVVVAAKLTATVGPTSGTTPLTVLTAPAVVGDGVKRFKVTVQIPTITSTTDDNLFDLSIMVGATVKRVYRFSSTGPSLSSGVSFSMSDVPAAGSTVYLLVVTRSGGSGTATFYADNTGVGWTPEIIVERMT